MGLLKYYVEKKQYLRHENKVNENKVLSYCIVLSQKALSDMTMIRLCMTLDV